MPIFNGLVLRQVADFASLSADYNNYVNSLFGSTFHKQPCLIIIIEDVAFSSHTDGGKLKYSTPSLMQLHGKAYEAFNSFDSVTYDVSLMDYDSMT